MTKERLTYVDTAKFLTIWLVIISHTDIGGTLLSKFLFSFHVPLFFVLSGYTSRKAERGVGFFTKKIQSSLVPYLIYAFLLGDRPNSLSMVFNVLYGSIQTTSLVTASHLWFLPCFFLAVAIYYLIEIVCREKLLFSTSVQLKFSKS